MTRTAFRLVMDLFYFDVALVVTLQVATWLYDRREEREKRKHLRCAEFPSL